MRWPSKQRLATRCRCGGKSRGLDRCDPVRPSRWCFSALPADDPHHIPEQHRRISPRRGVQMLTRALRRQESRGNYRAAEVLRRAVHLLSQVVRDRRIEAQKRKRAQEFAHGQFDAAEVLQHAIEWVKKAGGDVEAQMVLASVKLDLMRAS
jgi:hypothetical protein